MRLGVVSSGFGKISFEHGLDALAELGLDSIEIGCAGFHVDRQFGDPELLNSDPTQRRRWHHALESRGISVSALALHGEPLSPDPAAAATYDREFRAACRFAETIGVSRLTLLAGVPEGAPGDRSPCWIASAFPPLNQEILAWQWEERVIPYWREHAAIASQHGCMLCFEMHPNDVVYNPRTLLRLRAEIGDVVGANFDPSHLFWQGIDPLEALRALADCVFHVHAKDLGILSHNARVDGVLDTTPFERYRERAWSFRTVGFGHGADFWSAFVSALIEIGYGDTVSIEHEDHYMPFMEGLGKAVALLSPLLIGRSSAGADHARA